MDITTPSTAVTDRVTDMWVELADDQRAYGSHLFGPENRATIREVVLQRIAADNLLVARRDETVVGFVMFTLERGRYEQDVEPGLVENLYVDPGARREGIGTALLRAAEADLAAEGATTVRLEAMAPNEAAREFYTARGYTPHRVAFEKPVENDTS